MNKKLLVKPIAAIIGATVLTSLATVSFAAAEQNPFGMTGLSAGYTVAAGGSSASAGAAAGTSEATPAPTVKKKKHKKSAAKKPADASSADKTKMDSGK
jgi:hypothetical protein